MTSMCTYKRILSSLALLTLSSVLLNTASAEEFVLTSKPSKCISLSEGLVCYQKIRMGWEAPDAGDYCIVQLTTGKHLQCWIHQRQGEHVFEFAEKQSETYELRREGESNGLASTRVEVKWVYKTKHRDRLRWRVF